MFLIQKVRDQFAQRKKSSELDEQYNNIINNIINNDGRYE